MSNEKLHYGLLCNHINVLKAVDSVYTVECSDGIVDICLHCFIHGEEIKEHNNPYGTNASDYWYAGTVKDLLVYINGFQNKV